MCGWFGWDSGRSCEVTPEPYAGLAASSHLAGVVGDDVHSAVMDVAAEARRIAIGSDHAGYELKQHLVTVLLGQGYQVDDQGAHSTESVDYPAICAGVGRTVRDGAADVGVAASAAAAKASNSRPTRCEDRATLCNCFYTAEWRGPTTTPTCSRWAPGSLAKVSPRRSSPRFSPTDSRAADTPDESIKLTQLEANF